MILGLDFGYNLIFVGYRREKTILNQNYFPTILSQVTVAF